MCSVVKKACVRTMELNYLFFLSIIKYCVLLVVKHVLVVNCKSSVYPPKSREVLLLKRSVVWGSLLSEDVWTPLLCKTNILISWPVGYTDCCGQRVDRVLLHSTAQYCTFGLCCHLLFSFIFYLGWSRLGRFLWPWQTCTRDPWS